MEQCRVVGLTQLWLTAAVLGKPKVEQRRGVVTTRGYAKLNHVDDKGFHIIEPFVVQ